MNKNRLNKLASLYNRDKEYKKIKHMPQATTTAIMTTYRKGRRNGTTSTADWGERK